MPWIRSHAALELVYTAKGGYAWYKIIKGFEEDKENYVGAKKSMGRVWWRSSAVTKQKQFD